ncbi:hypothetical protein WBG78_26040 [Chryseolinea sp. T2]|uniref:hypothetical protein n=1 Tax=Chryseolinea sp. T2 TaxID=3129255 RepID=UPI003076E827
MSGSKITNEVRIPRKILSEALRRREIRALHACAIAKINGGHRMELKALQSKISVSDRTLRRYIEAMMARGWAGCDGQYLFPRSWRRLKVSKRGGLFLANSTATTKDLEVMAFVASLKSLIRNLGSPRSQKGRATPKDYPSRYLCKALGITERTFQRLKSRAVKEKLISVKRQYHVVGKAKHAKALIQNLPGLPLFVKEGKTIYPIPSRIDFLV